MFLKTEEWMALEEHARDYLAASEYSSCKGYFYLGVCFYKQGDFENAIKAFKEAETISPDDA
jgi:tetratricopeptide (TPR) repeat protein